MSEHIQGCPQSWPLVLEQTTSINGVPTLQYVRPKGWKPRAVASDLPKRCPACEKEMK